MNQATLNNIVAAAKAKAANSPRWIRAIDRAAEALASGELVVTLLHNGALVTSPRGSYFVNGCCECEASRRGHTECYHRAAVRLVELLENFAPGKTVKVRATKPDGVVVELHATVRIDTPQEVLYYKHGGILQYVLRQLQSKPEAAKA